MTKENANPIIYQVTSPNEVESEFNVASRILKRWTHHPDQEEEELLLLLEQQAAIAGRGSAQTSSSSSSSSSFPYYYDSLYHLEPHRYLTPSERSIKSTLASIEESFCKQKGNNEGPLDILQLAGIKTLTIKNQATGGVTSPANSSTSISSAGMYFFKPSDSAISQQQQQQQQQQQEWDTITQREVFDMIRNIQDPEHPLTLEQLNVVNYSHIAVTDNQYSSSTTVPNNNNNNNSNSDNHDAKEEETVHSFVDVKFTPTIPHCSMATLIGLCIRVKLLRSLPKRFKVTVRINPGTHASEVSINRQLNDKERVIAAMENVHLLSVVNKCIANGMQSSA